MLRKEKLILVTGASGSIGSVLFKELKKIPNTIVVGTSRKIDENCILHKCDLLKKEEIKQLFSIYYDFDYIFHFAANPIVDIKKTGIGEIYDNNVKTTLNLLECIPEGNCPVFVFASSTTVYDQKHLNDPVKPAREDMTTNPNSVYGACKVASEALVQAFGNMGRINPLILRYCAVVGPKFSHGVLPDLCRKYKNDEIVHILGNKPGSNKPFIHVDDAVSDTINLAFLGKTGIYNVCNEQTVSVQEIVDIISSYANVGKKEEKWVGNWVGDNLTVNVSNQKCLSDLNLEYHRYSSRRAIDNIVWGILNDNSKSSGKM